MLVVEGEDVGHGFSLMADLGASDGRAADTIEPISDRSAFTIFGFPITIAPGFLLGLLLLAGLNLQDPSFALGLVAAVAMFTLVHELGHALAARRFGAESEISLSFLVGWASLPAAAAVAARRAGGHHLRRAGDPDRAGHGDPGGPRRAALVLRRRPGRTAHAGAVVGRPDPRPGQPPARSTRWTAATSSPPASTPCSPARATASSRPGRWPSPSSPSSSSPSPPPTGRGPSRWRCSPSGTSAATPPAGPAPRARRKRPAGRSWPPRWPSATRGRRGGPACSRRRTRRRRGTGPTCCTRPAPTPRRGACSSRRSSGAAGRGCRPSTCASEQLLPLVELVPEPPPVGDLHAGIVLQKAMLDTGYLRRSADYGARLYESHPHPAVADLVANALGLLGYAEAADGWRRAATPDDRPSGFSPLVIVRDSSTHTGLRRVSTRRGGTRSRRGGGRWGRGPARWSRGRGW